MAISTGAAILAGSLGSAGIGALTNKRATDKAVSGQNAAIDEQRRQFNTIMELLAPGRNVGNQALNTLAQLFIPGFKPVGSGGGSPLAIAGPDMGGPEDPDFRRAMGPRGERVPATIDNNTGQVIDANTMTELFENLPGTQFALDQIEKNVGNSFAARGGAFGGNALRELTDRTTNFAYDKVINNLLNLAGFQPGATNAAVGAASNSGNNIAGLLSSIGGIKAGGIEGTGASINNALQGGLNSFLLMDLLKGGGGGGGGILL